MPAKVKVGANQAKLFLKKALARKRAADAPRPRKKKARAELPENQVIKTCLDFLKLRGWIVTRQHVGVYVPMSQHLMALANRNRKAGAVTIGTKNMPDYHAERVLRIGGRKINPRRNAPYFQVMLIEFKAPGKEPNSGQLTAIAKLNDLGTPAAWFDSFESFEKWYSKMAFDTMAGENNRTHRRTANDDSAMKRQSEVEQASTPEQQPVG